MRAPSRSSVAGMTPTPVSRLISPSCNGAASTNAEPSTGWPANGSSRRTGRAARAPARGARTGAAARRSATRRRDRPGRRADEPSPASARNGGGAGLRRTAATRGARSRRNRRRRPRGDRGPRRNRPGRRASTRLQPHHRCASRRTGARVPNRECRDHRPVSAIRVSDLRKSYGDHEAVRGISFDIREGEVFGLLGPNGAGKTTTVEILEGYRARDGGDVEVLGFDPARGEVAYRERIGVVLQQSQLFANLTVAETHRMFAGYCEHPR